MSASPNGHSISARGTARLPAERAPRLAIISPAPRGSTLGNSVTADRYAAIFRKSGWRVRVLATYDGQDVDVLVALHAKKSGAAALAFHRRYAKRPLIVVLTGTDLYRDIGSSRAAVRAMEAADALVTLQPLGCEELAPALRRKTVSIVQSAISPSRITRRAANAGSNGGRTLKVCVLGHLRREKDPLRAAYAVGRLPLGMSVAVTQAGAALDQRLARLAERAALRNPRYRWAGGLLRTGARKLLRKSDVMVISSRLEGGANVISEAIACGIPIFASAIPGNVGLLGARYPGLFALGDTGALAALMRRAVVDGHFLPLLRRTIRRLQPLVQPARERRAWLDLVGRLGSHHAHRGA